MEYVPFIVLALVVGGLIWAYGHIKSFHDKLDLLLHINATPAAAPPAPPAVIVNLPPPAAAAPPTAPPAANQALPGGWSAITTDPRKIPGGTTGYVGSPSNNLPGYQAAGMPYYDKNGYQLTNAGGWTGQMLNPNGDGTLVPIPAGAAPGQANPYVWNGAVFAQASGSWFGFPSQTPAPYDFTLLPNQPVAVATTSQGQGNLSCTITAVAGGTFPTNGDAFSVPVPTPCVLAVSGVGTVQLLKR